jgi:hypothetical protein
MQAKNIIRVSNFRSFREIKYKKNSYYIRSKLGSSVSKSSDVIITNNFKNVLPNFIFENKNVYSPMEMYIENNEKFDIYVNWKPISKERLEVFNNMIKILPENDNNYENMKNLKSKIEESFLINPEYLSYEIQKIEFVTSDSKIINQLWDFWKTFVIAFLNDYKNTILEAEFLITKDVIFYSGAPIFIQSMNSQLSNYSWTYEKDNKPLTNKRKEQILYFVKKSMEKFIFNITDLENLIKSFIPKQTFITNIISFLPFLSRNQDEEEKRKANILAYNAIITEYKRIVITIDELPFNPKSYIYLRKSNQEIIKLPIKATDENLSKFSKEIKLPVNPWSILDSIQLFDNVFETNLFFINDNTVNDYIEGYEEESEIKQISGRNISFQDNNKKNYKFFDENNKFVKDKFRELKNQKTLENDGINIDELSKKWNSSLLIHRFISIDSVNQIKQNDSFKSQVVDFYLSKDDLKSELSKITSSYCS